MATPPSVSEQVTLFALFWNVPPAGEQVGLGGAVVSRIMVSVNELDSVPAASLYLAYTVFVPSSEVRPQFLVVAKDSSEEKLVLSLEKRIFEHPLTLSEQVKPRVTDMLV